MNRRPIKERINEYAKKNPKSENISIYEANEIIRENTSPVEIALSAYTLGYMRGVNAAKKGGTK